MATITCKLPASLSTLLTQAAKKQRVPKSELVRDALHQYLPKQSERPSIHERWRKYCGVIKSGHGDLATNPRFMKDFGK